MEPVEYKNLVIVCGEIRQPLDAKMRQLFCMNKPGVVQTPWSPHYFYTFTPLTKHNVKGLERMKNCSLFLASE
jgi:hypothetical protein